MDILREQGADLYGYDLVRVTACLGGGNAECQCWQPVKDGEIAIEHDGTISVYDGSCCFVPSIFRTTWIKNYL